MLTKAISSILLIFLIYDAAPAYAVLRATRVERHLDDLKKTLERMPYTSEGAGPVIYVLEHPDCVPCKRFYLTFSGKDLGVELRHIFIAESEETANAAAELAATRNITDYRAMMDKSKIAPSYKRNAASRAALDSVMEPMRDWILPIMKKNGYSTYGIETPPIFFWEQLGVFFMEESYSLERFDEIINSTKMKLEDIKLPVEEIILMDGQMLYLPPLADDTDSELPGPPTAPGADIPTATGYPINTP